MMQCKVVTYFGPQYALLDINVKDEILNRAGSLHNNLVV
jgi:hypothetical protein